MLSALCPSDLACVLSAAVLNDTWMVQDFHFSVTFVRDQKTAKELDFWGFRPEEEEEDGNYAA